ncbi:MAG: transposase [Pseudobdellovibrio sp.]
MRKSQQFNLFKKDLRFYGGSLLYGKRKSIRPLNTKEAIHIVLRSSWGYGANSFLLLHNKKDIKHIILKTAKKYLIKVYRQAIVSNHLHLVIKISSRKNYQTFIRVLSSQIASHVMKMQSFKLFQSLLLKSAGDPHKSSQIQYQKAQQEPQGKGQAFWQFRPFTRILYWGKDFKSSCDYLLKNTLEAMGFIKYTKRKNLYNSKVKQKSG